MAELRSQPAVMKAARKKAIQEEKAAGDADEPMTLGTKVKLTEDTEVSVGTYDRFVRKRVGANDHYMFFDDDDEESEPVDLKNHPSEKWSVEEPAEGKVNDILYEMAEQRIAHSV
jgi:hypothetical protein